MHHIAPNSQIEGLLKTQILNINNAHNANDEQTEDKLKTEFKNEIENYLNQPHIYAIIKENNLINNNKFTHGDIIHAAFSNNPNNLVYGPNKDHRAHDPEQNKSIPPPERIDTEILNLQNQNYQNAFNVYNNPSQTTSQQLRHFSDLPVPDQLNWVLDSNGKYVAKN